MEFPLLSSLLKKMMKELNLKQADLALVLGVSLDRVKSLTSGKVKRMTREEGAVLVKQLRIRDEWLIYGEGPMLQSVDAGGETDDEFSARHDRIRRTHALVNSMPLSERTKLLLCAVMHGDPAHDGPLIAKAIQVDAMGTDSGAGKPMPAPSPRAAALMDNYDRASEDGKRLIEDTAAMAGQRPIAASPAPVKVKQNAKGPGSSIQVGGSISGSTVFNGEMDGDSAAAGGKRATRTSGARR